MTSIGEAIGEKEVITTAKEEDKENNENETGDDENLLPSQPITRICNDSVANFLQQKKLNLKTMFNKDSKDALRQAATTIITYIVSSINPQKKKTLTPEMIIDFAERSHIDGLKEALEAHQKKLPVPLHPLLLGRTGKTEQPKEITDKEQKEIISNVVKVFDAVDTSTSRKSLAELNELFKSQELLKAITEADQKIIDEMKKYIPKTTAEADDDEDNYDDEDMYDDE